MPKIKLHHMKPYRFLSEEEEEHRLCPFKQERPVKEDDEYEDSEYNPRECDRFSCMLFMQDECALLHISALKAIASFLKGVEQQLSELGEIFYVALKTEECKSKLRKAGKF